MMLLRVGRGPPGSTDDRASAYRCCRRFYSLWHTVVQGPHGRMTGTSPGAGNDDDDWD